MNNLITIAKDGIIEVQSDNNENVVVRTKKGFSIYDLDGILIKEIPANKGIQHFVAKDGKIIYRQGNHRMSVIDLLSGEQVGEYESDVKFRWLNVNDDGIYLIGANTVQVLDDNFKLKYMVISKDRIISFDSCSGSGLVFGTKYGISIPDKDDVVNGVIKARVTDPHRRNEFDEIQSISISKDFILYAGTVSGLLMLNMLDLSLKKLDLNGGVKKVIAVGDYVVTLDVAGRITIFNFKTGGQVTLTKMIFNRDIQIVADKLLVWQQNKEILLIPQKMFFPVFNVQGQYRHAPDNLKNKNILQSSSKGMAHHLEKVNKTYCP